MECPRSFSIGSWSEMVLPRSMLPADWRAPPACSRASNRVVLPAPGWPARATLRICCVEWGMGPILPCWGRPPAGVCGEIRVAARAPWSPSAGGSACGRHGSPREEERCRASVRSRGVMAGGHLIATARPRRVASQHPRRRARGGNATPGSVDGIVRTNRSARHMGISRKATARWEGDLKTGRGSLTTPASGLLDGTRYGFNSRFGEERGTNPEELIAAAHAGCFTMALSAKLTEAGHPPEWLEGTAAVDLSLEGGPTLSAIRLGMKAKVPGLDEKTFRAIADDAKQNCPVSKALSAVPITLEAELLG